MTIMTTVKTRLSLSDRKEGLKYSLNWGKKEASLLFALGYTFYRVKALKNQQNLFTLVPVSDKHEGEKGVHKLQPKAHGQAHMEFPASLTKKSPVGVKGKSCDTVLRVYPSGALQVQRPTAEAVSKAAAIKAFKNSGITSQLKLV